MWYALTVTETIVLFFFAEKENKNYTSIWTSKTVTFFRTRGTYWQYLIARWAVATAIVTFRWLSGKSKAQFLIKRMGSEDQFLGPPFTWLQSIRVRSVGLPKNRSKLLKGDFVRAVRRRGYVHRHKDTLKPVWWQMNYKLHVDWAAN
jgi:hypothetical protein